MNDLMAPDVALGAIALAIVVIYAAWYEYSSKNHRDAKLLAAIGAASMVGSAFAWLQ
jgi:uncharacterized membrane protein YfcA